MGRSVLNYDKPCLNITGFHFCNPENDSCLSYDRVHAVMLSAFAVDNITNLSTTTSSSTSPRWSIHNSMLFASQVVTTIGKSCEIWDVISPSSARYPDISSDILCLNNHTIIDIIPEQRNYEESVWFLYVSHCGWLCFSISRWRLFVFMKCNSNVEIIICLFAYEFIYIYMLICISLYTVVHTII